uniref:Uncharacterized protein n=1 Tax=Thermogemmatispora argillosa TaxID=2045280 RepID=A0A455T8M9_9CHLR|nr:hypothetical protein KTA_40370 [Thermogemmatispora argillosa]
MTTPPAHAGGCWSHKASARHAAGWDGLCPARLATNGAFEPFTPARVAASRHFLLVERASLEGFDLVVGGLGPNDCTQALSLSFFLL